MGTVTKVTGELSTLETNDVSDGLYEYAQQYKEGARGSFVGFKDHVLDLAVVAFADDTVADGGSRRAALSKTVKGRQLLQLPLAGVYAMVALLLLVLFSVVHFPRKYAPIAYAKAKDKAIEYRVTEKLVAAKNAAVEKATPLLAKASASPHMLLVQEKIKMAHTKAGEAYTAAASSAMAAKASEAADKLRGKIGSELVKLRGEQHSANSSILPQ